MLAMFLGALNIALACALFAADKADENLRRADENGSNDDRGCLNGD